MSGSTRIGVGVSDDLVVVRHHGSVSGSTSSLRAVSDDLVVVRHHGSVSGNTEYGMSGNTSDVRVSSQG